MATCKTKNEHVQDRMNVGTRVAGRWGSVTVISSQIIDLAQPFPMKWDPLSIATSTLMFVRNTGRVVGCLDSKLLEGTDNGSCPSARNFVTTNLDADPTYRALVIS